MNTGKKHVVISQEEYDRLKESSINHHVIVNPEKREMKKSENEMREVWNRDDLHTDEKIEHFTKELNNLKQRYDEMKKPRPLEMIMKTTNSDVENKDNFKERVLQSASKSNRANVELLIDYLKTKPNIIKWNDQGELIFRDQVIPGSNMTDMIIDATTSRKQSTIPAMFKSIFLKAIAEANVPSRWIKNREHNSILQSYNDMKSKSLYTPDKKKPKIDWLSST